MRSLDRLPREARAALTKGMVRNADQIVRRAKTLAPDDTGDLRDSLQFDVGATGRGAVVRVFTPLFYSRFVEFGTRATPAQPFFWPAIRGLKARAQRQIATALRRAARAAVVGR